MEQTIDENRIIRYLLGDLPEEEMIRIEERFFADDEYFELLEAVEYDLIDRYVRGELAPRERRQFEEHFLASPQRRERVEAAGAFLQTLSGPAAAEAPAQLEEASWWPSLWAFLRPQGPAFRFAVAAIILVVVLGGWWAVRLRTQLQQLQAQRQELERRREQLQQQIAEQQQRRDELSEQLQREQQERDQLEQELARLEPLKQAVVPFELSPNLTREGGESATLTVPRGARSVRFRVVLEGESAYRRFRAVLLNAADDEVWRWDGLRATERGQAVVVRAPARLLAAGHYTLALLGVAAEGEDVVNYYSFSVAQR
jgi:flagellar motility protein MotE (MotC chaperone)